MTDRPPLETINHSIKNLSSATAHRLKIPQRFPFRILLPRLPGYHSQNFTISASIVFSLDVTRDVTDALQPTDRFDDEDRLLFDKQFTL